MKLIALLLLLSVATTLASEYCYIEDPLHPQKAYQGTHTSYENSGGDFGTSHITPGCTASKIISLNRHGTRFAQTNQAVDMQNLGVVRDQIIVNNQNGLGTMCAADIEALRNWSPHPGSSPENNMQLANAGWEELYQNAQHLQRLFPTLIPKVYNEKHFSFRHTSTPRTRDSAISYIRGLFGPDAETFVKIPAPIEYDPLLYYLNCPDHLDLFDTAYLPGNAMYNLTRSAEAQKIVMQVSSRLGYETPLTFEEVSTMQDACTFEQAWLPHDSSPWCSVFLPGHMRFFEFENEMMFDLFSGKNGTYTRTAPCSLVKMILTELGRTDNEKAFFYFSHDGVLNILLNALDVIDYDEVNIENYEALLTREWPISMRLPFAMNIVAVRYDCPDDVEQIKFKLFLNERPVKARGCDNHLCNYTDLLRTFGKYLCVDCDGIRCQGGHF